MFCLPLLLFVATVVAQDAHTLRILLEDQTVGLFRFFADANKQANFTSVTALGLPKGPCGAWNLGNGTRGQTSAAFHTNSSWFFVGEQLCPDYSGKSLFQASGPFQSASSTVRVMQLADLGQFVGTLDQFSVNWDWTCNVVVQGPTSDTAAAVWQISEYDAQVRPQAIVDTDRCNGSVCWRKVSGMSALDTGSEQPFWDPELAEWNCGDSCALVTLEEQYSSATGVASTPRQMVGRSFRTGTVLFNVTDRAQAKSMIYVPTLRSYFGLGHCCDAATAKCLCEGNNLMLFQHSRNATVGTWNVVHQFTGGDSKDEAIAIQLGVEVGNLFDADRLHKAPVRHQDMSDVYLFVYYQSRVLTISARLNADGSLHTSVDGYSAPFTGGTPHTWSWSAW